MTFINPVTGDFEMNNNFASDAKIANILGYKSITLLQGKYKTTKTRRGLLRSL